MGIEKLPPLYPSQEDEERVEARSKQHVEEQEYLLDVLDRAQDNYYSIRENSDDSVTFFDHKGHAVLHTTKKELELLEKLRVSRENRKLFKPEEPGALSH